MKGAVPDERPATKGAEATGAFPTLPRDPDVPSSSRGQLHNAGTTPAHLRLFVPGLPRPQGSMRGFAIGGKVRVVPGNAEGLAAWRSAISHAVYDLWGDHPPLDGPLIVVLDFWLPRPKSAPKKRLHPDRLPDIDKLARAVLDSLTGLVFTDDARVVRLVADKNYAIDRPTGAHIYVAPVEV